MNEISKAYNLYKNNLKIVLPRFFEVMFLMIFFIIFMFIFMSLAGINIFSTSYFEDARYMGNFEADTIAKYEKSLILMMIIFPILYLYVNSAANSAIIKMAIVANEIGKAEIKYGIEGVKKYSFKIFVFQLFRILVLLIFMFIFGVLVAILGFANRSFEEVLLYILIITIFVSLIYGIFYAFTLLTPQYIVFDKKMLDAMEHSLKYVKNNIGKIFIYGMLVFVAMLVIFILPILISYPLSIVSKKIGDIANIFTTLLLIVFITPYFEVLKTVMVLEYEKNRKESFENSDNRW